MELSKRLFMVASMVKKGSIVADVGCDHGYVAIWLIREGISPRVLAMDVNSGPLERAREHVEQAGLVSYIQLRLSDGLREMRMMEDGPEADTLLAAGMGGRLVARILQDGAGKLAGMKAVILQPQSEPWLVRQTLRELGYVITAENMVREDGKFYTALRAENGRSVPKPAPEPPSGVLYETSDGFRYEPPAGLELTREQWREGADRFGPLLIQRSDPTLAESLQESLEKHAMIREKIRREEAGEEGCLRLTQLEEEDRLMERILSFIRQESR